MITILLPLRSARAEDPVPPESQASAGELLTNGSFESGSTGWTVWWGTAGVDGNASFNEQRWGAHDGATYRAHWKASAYSVATAQKVTVNRSSAYIASGWFETSCNGTSNFAVKDLTTGSYLVVQALPRCKSAWTYIQLPAVDASVHTELQVEIVSFNPASEWIRFDQVSLVDAVSCANCQ